MVQNATNIPPSSILSDRIPVQPALPPSGNGAGKPSKSHSPPPANEIRLTDAMKRDLFSQADLPSENVNAYRVNSQIDPSTGRSIIRVIDSNSEEVIREIPSEEMQEFYRRHQETMGNLFDREG